VGPHKKTRNAPAPGLKGSEALSTWRSVFYSRRTIEDAQQAIARGDGVLGTANVGVSPELTLTTAHG